MERTWRAGTDQAVGMAILGVVVAAIGAVLMIGGALTDLAALGFAIALVGGTLAIVAVHAYGG